MTPSELFHQYPADLPGARDKAGASLPRPSALPERREKPPRFTEPDYIPVADAARMFSQSTPLNDFEQWLCRAAGREAAMAALQHYYVGRSGLFGGSPVFWQIDTELNVRTGKVMAYDIRGHRRRDLPKGVAFLHNYQPRRDFDYRMCYFGTHLTRHFPDAALVMVESEKSALLLAAWLLRRGAFGTRYLPLATGSCSNLTVDPVRHANDMWYRSRVMTGKRLILLPDGDATDRWQAHIPQLLRVASAVRLIDLRPWLPFPEGDIADLLAARPR